MRKELSMKDIIMSLKECSKDSLLNVYNDTKDMKIVIEEDKIDELAKIFGAFSNPLRLKIITLLAQVPMPVCIITALTKADQSLISHHLNHLRKLGIVKIRSVGRYRFYEISDNSIVKKLLKIIQTHKPKNLEKIEG